LRYSTSLRRHYPDQVLRVEGERPSSQPGHAELPVLGCLPHSIRLGADRQVDRSLDGRLIKAITAAAQR